MRRRNHENLENPENGLTLAIRATSRRLCSLYFRIHSVLRPVRLILYSSESNESVQSGNEGRIFLRAAAKRSEHERNAFAREEVMGFSSSGIKRPFLDVGPRT
jgi:hypothetical protein